MGKEISEDDRNLFRDSMGEVKPVPNPRVLHPRIKKKPRKPQVKIEIENTKLDAQRIDKIQMSDNLWFARDGIQEKQLKRLRQGKFPSQAECDLHGLTLREAEQTLEHFIHECLARDYRHIHIVHGKGYRSENQQPVLKNYINQALREFADVLAFCTAQAKDGGLGAVYVLLRAN